MPQACKFPHVTHVPEDAEWYATAMACDFISRQRDAGTFVPVEPPVKGRKRKAAAVAAPNNGATGAVAAEATDLDGLGRLRAWLDLTAPVEVMA